MKKRILFAITSVIITALVMMMASATSSQAVTILHKRIVDVTGGITVTMRYDQKVLSGQDEIMATGYTVCGLPSGKTAFPHLHVETSVHVWDATPAGTTPSSQNCGTWAMSQTTWAPLGYISPGVSRAQLWFDTDAPSGSWTLYIYESSGTVDPGGRPTANLVTDFVKNTK